MASPRLSRNGLSKKSIATAALAAAFVITPIVAQAQDSAPPPPDQYGNPNPYQGQSAPPDDGMQYDAAVQNGAPQGVQQQPPAIPDYEQPPAPGDGYETRVGPGNVELTVVVDSPCHDRAVTLET